MEALKTFLTGLSVIAIVLYLMFLIYAFVETIVSGFDWYSAVAIPGWFVVVIMFIMSLGSMIRGEPNRSDWY